MLTKRLSAALIASLFLAACGGGDDNELSQEHGVILTVNGSTHVGDRTLKQMELNRTNAGTTFENCLQTVTNADSVDVQIPYYDNYETLGAETSEYCNGTRLSVSSYLAFQIRFLNNTYDPMELTYTGVGVEIRVYDTASGTEVWNSLIAQSLSNDYYGLPAFNPFETHSITLKAGESFPNQRNYAINYNFLGDGNYADSDPATYQLETDYQALGWDVSDATQSQCELSTLKAGTIAEGLGTAVTTDDRTRAYQKPVCQTEALAPGRYRVSVTYSFTPAVAPVEFYVTIEAPDAS